MISSTTFKIKNPLQSNQIIIYSAFNNTMKKKNTEIQKNKNKNKNQGENWYLNGERGELSVRDGKASMWDLVNLKNLIIRPSYNSSF